MISWSHALVTGGAGFIGSHLTRALLAEGRRVTVLDNLSVGRREVVPGEARFVHGDVRDEAAIADALAGVDCVFHLAAQVTIRGSFDRFHEDLDTNVMGTARLLRAVDHKQVKWFTLASSMAVYADADSPRPIDESHSTRPLSPYGVGKLAAEDISQQILEGARHSVHRDALLQHLRPRPGLHAVCRRADDLHHAAPARRVDHHFRRRRAATRFHPRA
jgi:nucleoside-diphosphate-sugar epimerase